jgi:hypothetical protein
MADLRLCTATRHNTYRRETADGERTYFRHLLNPEVRFGPTADSCTAAKARLINHLVGGGEQRRRHIKPECLGVLRLTTSSNLTGAWTGSSLGFEPLRMRLAYNAARRYSSTI